MNQKIFTKEVFIIILFFIFSIFLTKIFEFFKNDYIINNDTSAFYFVCFIVVIMFFGRELYHDWKKFKIVEFIDVLDLFFLGLLLTIISSILISNLKIVNINQTGIDSLYQSEQINLIWLKITVFFIGPITEEVIFRLSVFKIFGSRKIVSLVVSIFLFGFMHVFRYILIYGRFEQLIVMIIYLCMGTGFALIYKRTNNIWYSILAHIIINFV